MTVLFVLCYTIGGATALSWLQRYPTDPAPRNDVAACWRLARIAPLLSSAGNGAAWMTLGIAGLVWRRFELSLVLAAAVVALFQGANAIVSRDVWAHPRESLLQFRRRAAFAARTAAVAALIGFIEGVMQGRTATLYMVAVGVLLLATSQVNRVLMGAIDELLSVSPE